MFIKLIPLHCYMDRVLLVEPDRDLFDEYWYGLTRFGDFQVDFCFDTSVFKKCINKSRIEPLDAILMDIDWLGVDGLIIMAQAIKNKTIDPNRTFLVGLYDALENPQEWQEVANLECFFNKIDIGNYRLKSILNEELIKYRSSRI